jgi:hypothetical protein
MMSGEVVLLLGIITNAPILNARIELISIDRFIIPGKNGLERLTKINL